MEFHLRAYNALVRACNTHYCDVGDFIPDDQLVSNPLNWRQDFGYPYPSPHAFEVCADESRSFEALEESMRNEGIASNISFRLIGEFVWDFDSRQWDANCTITHDNPSEGLFLP